MKKVFLLFCFAAILAGRSAYPFGNTGVFSGQVLDQETEKPVPKAFLTARSTSRSFNATTDESGFFSIAGMSPGHYEVTVERVGYQTLRLPGVLITADATTNLSLALSPEAFTVSGVTVTGARGILLNPRQTITNYGYSDAEAKALFPGPAGLNTRSIYENLPGVQTGYDVYYGIALPHIRGGTGYDVGYAFDGVPTYENITASENKFNATGTNFTNIGTARTDVYVGAYPAQYGNFISGFINQVAKQGYGPIHGSLEFQSGFWTDSAALLPSYNPANGTLAAYNGPGTYSPTNVNFELSGRDRRFSYYFNHVIQDDGMVSYASNVDLKPLANELGGTLPYSTQSRDTVLNLNYNLNPYNDLQFLVYSGIAKLNYAGFQELPCNINVTTGCQITSNPAGTGFSETFNANNIRPLADTHDEYSYDLEKFEWNHRFLKTGSILAVRAWQYSPNFYFNRFDQPSTLYEFERSVTQGILVEHQNQITPQHLMNIGASFSYSKNFFQSSQNDFSAPHFNSAEGILYGFGAGQSQPGVANILLVPDTQNWSAWLTDEWRPTPKIVVEGGLRWDMQTTLRLTGPGINTDSNGLPFVSPSICPSQGLCLDPARFNPSQITPRIGASYQWTVDFAVKASYGKFVTFPPARRIEAARYNASFVGGPAIITSLPSTAVAAFQLLGSKPQYGETFDISFETKLSPENILTITPYVKHIRDPLQNTIVGGLPATVNAGTFESKGVELLLKTSEWHGISGWLSYTYSDSRASSQPFQTDLLSGAVINPTIGITAAQGAADALAMAPTAYDERHRLNLALNIRRGNWEFSPNLSYGSGAPYGLGLDNLKALAVLQDPLSYANGGVRTVAQSVAATAGFNPLGEAGFNGLRTAPWLLANLGITYHINKDTSVLFSVFNLFNSNQILGYDNTVFSGSGYAELTNPNQAFPYTSNDTTKNIQPQYSPLQGQYAPVGFPNLRQFYLTLKVNL